MRTMSDLSLHFLQDIYDAEKRAVRSMQRMARAATDEELKHAILQHRDQSQEQITRLEHVFELTTGKRPRGKTCAAMAGLVKEVEEAIEEAEKGPVLDAALIACAQAIEHYEMARYGCMVAWARQAGKEDVASLLHETLEEEKASDQLLTSLAERLINPEVPEEEDHAEPEEEEHHAPPPSRRKKAAAPAPEPAPAPAKRGRKPAAPAPEPEPPPAAKGRGRRAAAK